MIVNMLTQVSFLLPLLQFAKTTSMDPTVVSIVLALLRIRSHVTESMAHAYVAKVGTVQHVN